MKDTKKNVLQMPEELIADMNAHLPGDLTIRDIQTLVGTRKFKVLFYANETLLNSDTMDIELSNRSANALKREGFHTVGDLLACQDLSEQLGRIRNCGAKSKSEIMGRLFFYQYSLIPMERRTDYMMKILELNGIRKIS